MVADNNNNGRQWSGKTLGTIAGHKAFLFILTFFGRSFADIFLIPVTLFYYVFINKSRAGSKQYFKNLYPGISCVKIWLFSYKRVLSFAHTLLDKVFMYIKGPGVFTTQFNDTKHIFEALQAGKGLLIISAHIGNWDIVSRYFTRFNSKISVVMLNAERPEIKKMYDELTKGSVLPYQSIYSNDPLDALFKIRDALARNEIVVMHGDRAMGKTIEHEFLGKKAFWSVFPFFIASKTGSPIVAAFGIRLKKMAYKAVVYPSFTILDESEESVINGLKTYISILKNIVNTFPFQWFNFYNFWNEYE